MPFIDSSDGERRWYESDAEIAQRIDLLNGYGRPTTGQRAELAALIGHQARHASLVRQAASPTAHQPGADPGSRYAEAAQAERDRMSGAGWQADPPERLGRVMAGHPDVVISRARRMLDADHRRGLVPDRAAGRLEAALTASGIGWGTRAGLAAYLVATGSPEYAEAFARSLLDRDRFGLEAPGDLRDALGRAFSARALLEGTAGAWASGSYPVPYQLDPTVTLTSNGAINPLRQVARTEQIVGKAWLGVTSAGVTVTRQAEAGESADAAPVLAQPEVAPSRVTGFVPFSVEVEQDWNGLLAEIAMMLADAKDVEEAASFTTGSGTAPAPQGIVTALAGGPQEVTTAAAGTVALADIVAAQKTVAPRFRAGATALGSLDFALFGRTHERVTGTPILGDLAGDGGADLIGWPFRELSALSAISPGGVVAVMGDFRQFLIVDRVGMSVELVPHLFGASRFPTGQRGIYAIWRNACQVLAPAAFAALLVHS